MAEPDDRTEMPPNERVAPTEGENDVADQTPDPEFDQPLTKPNGEPAWKEKETSKWPIYVVLGALVLLVGVVVATNLKPKASSESTGPVHALTTDTPPNVPVDPETLAVDALYEVREGAVLLTCDPATGPNKELPPATQFVVHASKVEDGGTWYSITVPGTKDKGWISVKSLLGKKVVLVRSHYKM